MNDVLTDALINSLTPIGLKFPKSIPKKRKTMADYAQKQRQMPKVAKKKKSMGKRLPSIKSIKDKANTLFSNFIKNRDNRTCVLCKSTLSPTAGHLIKRGKMATKFDEGNVFCLCNKCNFKDWKTDAYHDVYVAWFIEKYGASKYIVLVEKSKQIKQMKRADFENIIKRYGHMAKP